MLAERIAIYQTLKDNAELKNITISISPTGKYYASCLFEEEQDYQVRQEKTEKVIGLDMSLRDFYVDNLGNTPEYRRVYRKSVDMAALALGSKGETAVETPAMGKSRNLEEQASQETQASSPCLRHGLADGVFQ
jgi:hypothetical protein